MMIDYYSDIETEVKDICILRELIMQ